MREALGRSRDGFGTKACVIADGAGWAIALKPAARAVKPVRIQAEQVRSLARAVRSAACSVRSSTSPVLLSDSDTTICPYPRSFLPLRMTKVALLEKVEHR